jgi:SAM-dependent methyltransferase
MISQNKMISLALPAFLAFGCLNDAGPSEGVAAARVENAAQDPVRRDVPYVPTPEPVVEAMLKMVNVTKEDKVYDLGCGDGRIVVMAAQKYGAKGVGVDIDPQRIKESNENARAAGVTDKVEFHIRDLFKMDFSDATVVTLYLLPDINVKLRPRLLDELKPGTRIVSHDFMIGDWKPDKQQTVEASRTHSLYFWWVPAHVAGEWQLTSGSNTYTLSLDQRYQQVVGTLRAGNRSAGLTNVKLEGDRLSFQADIPGQGTRMVSAKVEGEKMTGEIHPTDQRAAQMVRFTGTRTVKGGPLHGDGD